MRVTSNGVVEMPTDSAADGSDSNAPSVNRQGPSRSERSATGLLSGLSDSSAESERRTASSVYREQRMYHGTIRSSKKAIQDEGFDVSRKVKGATAEPDEHRHDNFAQAAATHNYLTSSKDTARQCGVYDSEARREPALVRVLGARDEVSLENDPDSGAPGSNDYNVAFRTKQPIPSKFVLGSKRSAPGADAVVFQKNLAKAGLNVTTARAGELLREQQSDSEDDF